MELLISLSACSLFWAFVSTKNKEDNAGIYPSASRKIIDEDR
jgi:hypothetical protein